MTHPFGRPTLIVNPHAGRGAVAHGLPTLRAALDREDVEHDVVETAGPGAAVAAARRALEEGCTYLVAVGGDGTVHEIVNGMFSDGEAVNPDAVLGVASTGSGCDFIRTFGLSRGPDAIARHLATDAVLPIDVGRATFLDAEGRESERLFVNIAEVGYGAEAVRLAERLPRSLGRLRYLFGAWGAIRRMTRPEATVVLGHTTQTRPLVNLVVANCQFFGGGMKVAPRALPDDGKFNVQLFFGERSQMFTLTQKIYRGEHVPNPKISEYQSPIVEVTAPEALRVEADGEVLGTTPATFSLLEKALRLKI